jgi:hypothetical protein
MKCTKKKEDNSMNADPIFALVTMILSASYFLDIHFFLDIYTMFFYSTWREEYASMISSTPLLIKKNLSQD